LFISLCACSHNDNGSTIDDGSAIYIDLVDASVDPVSVARSNPQDLTISWKVNFFSNTGAYKLSVYLSSDDVLDEDDSLLFSNVFSSAQGSVSIYSDNSDLANIYSSLPNKHYFILEAVITNTYGQEVLLDLDNDGEPEEIRDIYAVPFVLKESTKKWTVMVYMAGDNNLSSYVAYDLGEMSDVGSTQNVNILALADTSGDSAKLYYVEKNNVEELQDFGELNMAEAQNLVDFVSWVVDVYPAERYLLILWDHGLGFKQYLDLKRDLCVDEDPVYSWMDIPTLGQALAEIKNILGKPIDVLGFDACLMNMLEVAYEVRNYALFMVGSENYELGNGWPYDLFLDQLVKNPSATPSEVAQYIVQNYPNEEDYYDPVKHQWLYYRDRNDVTLAAINLSKIEDVKNALDSMAQKLVNLMQDDPEVAPIVATVKLGYAYAIARIAEESPVPIVVARRYIGKIKTSAEEVVEVMPEQPLAHAFRAGVDAGIMRRVGKFTGRMTYGARTTTVEESFAEAMEMAGDIPIVNYEYANALIYMNRKRDLNEAISYLEKAMKIRPEFSMDALDVMYSYKRLQEVRLYALNFRSFRKFEKLRRKFSKQTDRNLTSIISEPLSMDMLNNPEKYVLPERG
jgi:tetratricopeptide (TPR) repeat protein